MNKSNVYGNLAYKLLPPKTLQKYITASFI